MGRWKHFKQLEAVFMKWLIIIILLLLGIFVYLISGHIGERNLNNELSDIFEVTKSASHVKIQRVINQTGVGVAVKLEKDSFPVLVEILQEHAQQIKSAIMDFHLGISVIYYDNKKQYTFNFIWGESVAYIAYDIGHEQAIIYIDAEGGKKIYDMFEIYLRLEEKKVSRNF